MTRRLILVLMASTILLTGVWSATAVGSATDGRGTFTDDDGSVHEADINGLAAADVTRGCNPPANNEYCPSRAVTRAEMASFLVRALDLPSAGSNPFNDTAGSIHVADINALAQAGITLGCNPPANSNYCPNQAVTREQMASFLTRALDLERTSASSFTDTAGSIHLADINALAEAGITRGCNPPSNTRFCPGEAVTRAQMASFLVRAVDGITPRLNRLSMRAGERCTKDGLSCTARVTLARNIQLEVTEGWYQVLPYLPGEESALKASTTRVTFTWDGAALTPEYLGLREGSSSADRRWQVRPPALTAGTHTLRGVWTWNGTTTQTVTFVITVP